jgi:hypothetical protein
MKNDSRSEWQRYAEGVREAQWRGMAMRPKPPEPRPTSHTGERLFTDRERGWVSPLGGEARRGPR